MNKIESGEKLDFHNVLIRPKRSTLNSRSEVDLSRSFKFKYSTKTWDGVPIIAANMDSTGTFDVYKCLSNHKIVTALHKFYTLDDYKYFKQNHNVNTKYFMVSTGINKNAIEKLQDIFKIIECDWICVDIANGYISNFVQFCADDSRIGNVFKNIDQVYIKYTI